MGWHADHRKKSGGYWRCRIKHSEQSLRYLYETEKGRARLRRQVLAQSVRYREEQIRRINKELTTA